MFLKCKTPKYWNDLPNYITLKECHIEFKKEFCNFKFISFKISDLDFKLNVPPKLNVTVSRYVLFPSVHHLHTFTLLFLSSQYSISFSYFALHLTGLSLFSKTLVFSLDSN